MAGTPLIREERQRGWLGLAGLVVGLAASALVLQQVAGPPHLPSRLPGWEIILATLRGSYLPSEALAYVLTTAAWLVWLWLTTSLALRLLVGLADARTHGAGWVRALHALSDRVTLPIVRRAVDGALVAIVVVNLLARSPASAAAAPREPAAAVMVAGDPAPPADPPAAQPAEAPGTIAYTVQPGDTLWAISEQFYGTGEDFPRLVSANVGRVMPDGQRFTQAGVIHPGWVLLIPLPSHAVQQADGQTAYVVEPGDTLRGIAARFLGDEARWPEIFDLNRGTASVDGRLLTNPDLIWPGLRLALPLSIPDQAVTPPPAPSPPTPELPPAMPTTPPPDTAPSPSPADRPEPTPAASPTPATTAEPAPNPACPTPAVSAATPPPAASATPAVSPGPQPTSGDGAPSPLIYGAAGLTAAALASGAALLMRRRGRRSLDEPPLPSPGKSRPAPGDDFAETELTRVWTHRLRGGDVELAVLVADQARRFLAEQGADAALVLAYQGSNTVALLFQTTLADQPHLLDLAAPFAARVGAAGQAGLTAEGDVVWRLSGLKSAGLLTPPTGPAAHAPPLIAMGVAPSRELVYAAWSALGHILIAGLPGSGTDVVLTTLLAAVAARRPPDALRLWMVADPRTVPRQLGHLPHRGGDVIDPEDTAAVRAVLANLRSELLRRMRAAEQDGAARWQPQPDQPELLLVVTELGTLEDDGTTLELIGAHGPAYGIRLLAATTEPGSVGDEVLAHFTTRLVLQTLDDDESIHLLGRPDAVDLSTGELLLRIDGREPVRLRGFRVSPDHLDELVRLMREADGGERGAVGVAAPARDESGAETARPDQEAPASRDAGDHAAGAGRVLAEPLEVADPTDQTGPEGAGEHEPDATATELAPAAEHEPNARASAAPVAQEEAHIELDETGDEIVPPAAAIPPLDGDAVPVNSATNRAVRPAPRARTEPPGWSDEEPGQGTLLQVRCLGEFVVRSGQQELRPIGEEGGSYKAWEILAFLACQPGMAASRERLLAAIWPDIDEGRAANRMRVAMVRLRGLLARQVPGLTAEVVRCERDGICRLDARLVWSDAQEFVALCGTSTKLPPEEAKGALEEARTLYRGDLLSGRGARDYDWVDERDASGLSPRERFREEYYRATQRLARLYRQEGQPARAVPLYKELLKAEPTLEDIVRELYQCYRDLGDLSSLIREDRHFRQALREAYFDPNDPDDDPELYQPEPETNALFIQIRTELEGRAT